MSPAHRIHSSFDMNTHHTRPLLAAALLLGGILTWTTPASAVTWIAGADLAANEQPDGPQELNSINPTVPQWSYGARSTILGTSFTPFTPAEHGNDISGYTNFDGFSANGQIIVNAGAAPIITNNGAGPLDPLASHDIYVHPGVSMNPVVRWTAPVTGTFSVSAFWDDNDPYGGDGGSGNVVVNGVSVFGVTYANTGGATMPTTNFNLNAGDFVDFVLGRNATVAHDGTSFNATIIGMAAPEPSRALLLALAAASLMLRRRRRS